MEEYQALVSIVSLTMGVSWASSVNLYAALLVLGLGGITGNIDLPPDLETLQNPLVIMAAGVMYAAEDIAVFAGLWAALTHPIVFIALIIIFLLLAIWLLPRIWAGVKFLFRKLAQLFGFSEKDISETNGPISTASVSVKRTKESGNIEHRLIPDVVPISASPTSSGIVTQLEKLKALLDGGAISAREYEKLKVKLIPG